MDRTRLDWLKAQRSKFIMSFNSHVGTYSQNLFKFRLAQHAVTPNRLAIFSGSELPWTKTRFETIPPKHLGKEHDYPWEKTWIMNSSFCTAEGTTHFKSLKPFASGQEIQQRSANVVTCSNIYIFSGCRRSTAVFSIPLLHFPHS